MRMINKPWGYEEIVEENEHYVVKKLVINAGHRLSLQFHREKHETLVLLTGEVKMTLSEPGHAVDYKGEISRSVRTSDHVMHPGFYQVIKPNTIHRIQAIKDSTIIECSTTELEDVVRLEDDYDRQ